MKINIAGKHSREVREGGLTKRDFFSLVSKCDEGVYLEVLSVLVCVCVWCESVRKVFDEMLLRGKSDAGTIVTGGAEGVCGESAAAGNNWSL